MLDTGAMNILWLTPTMALAKRRRMWLWGLEQKSLHALCYTSHRCSTQQAHLTLTVFQGALQASLQAMGTRDACPTLAAHLGNIINASTSLTLCCVKRAIAAPRH